MASLVAGYGVAHTGMMITEFRPGVESHERVYAGFERVRREIEELKPDVLVMFGADHLNTFGYSCLPQICIGIGTSCTGWGDGGVPEVPVAIAGDLAAGILQAGVAEGFDLAFSVDPRIDHAFMAPLSLLRPGFDLPIIPVFMNTNTPPLAPLGRAAELGRLVAHAIESSATDSRVVVVGTGGLSHWVGTPQMGHINTEFDAAFLRSVEAGDLDAIVALTNADLIAVAGNGTPEIRTWAAAMACRPEPGTVLAYEAVGEWATGIAVARLFGGPVR